MTKNYKYKQRPVKVKSLLLPFSLVECRDSKTSAFILREVKVSSEFYKLCEVEDEVFGIKNTPTYAFYLKRQFRTFKVIFSSGHGSSHYFWPLANLEVFVNWMIWFFVRKPIGHLKVKTQDSFVENNEICL